MEYKDQYKYLIFINLAIVLVFFSSKSHSQRDITFVTLSELHYGIQGCDKANIATIEYLNELQGLSYPDSIGGMVDAPRGVIICGDITEGGTAMEWEMFVNDWGMNGEANMKFPVYEGYGNHDGGIFDPVAQGIIKRNKKRKGLTGLCENGLNYSWDWDDVHFVVLNKYPSVDYVGSSLKFLEFDLTENVARSGRPVVIFAHYGFDRLSIKYWSEEDRESLYDIIKDYNVLGYFHGHTHSHAHRKWKGFDIYDNGSVKSWKPNAGECLVIHMKDDQMTVLNRVDTAWREVWQKRIDYEGYFLAANFFSDKVKVCNKNIIHFIDNTVGVPDSRKWIFEGGTPDRSNELNPVVNYKKEGAFDVTLIVSNRRRSDTLKMNDYIKVIASSVSAKYTLDEKKIAQGDSIRFKDLSENDPMFWEWNFEGGIPLSSADQNPIVSYKTPGSYQVSLTVENECGRDIERVDGFVRVKAIVPEADFTTSNTSIGCSYERVWFKNQSLGASKELAWTFEGGIPSSSSNENPLVTYSSPGTYDVMLVVSNQSGSDIEIKKDYIFVGKGKNIPIMEDFEGEFPPVGWSIINYDNSVTWEQQSYIGMSSSNCLLLNNTINMKVGEVDEIILPAVNLSSSDVSKLTFEVAYTRYDNKRSDRLKIFVSDDCGTTWNEVYNKTLLELETTIIESYNQSNDWIPFHKNNWRKEIIDLIAYEGKSNVIVKFQNTSGFGTRIWIDNVGID